MRLKNIALAGAASALMLSTVATAQAETVRTAAPVSEESEMAGGPLLYVVGAIVVGLAVLEITGAINIFDEDDEPVSP